MISSVITSHCNSLGEVHLLVKEQESAVKAVKLERLVGDIGVGRGGRGARGGRRESSRLSQGTRSEREEEESEEGEVEEMMTEAETRRIMMLTEPPRPWLHPHYNV